MQNKGQKKLKSVPTQLTHDLDKTKLSFFQLNGLIESIGFLSLTTSPNKYMFGKTLTTHLYEAVTERNFKAYEYKLYEKNLPHLGPISRAKYDRLVLFSKVVMDGIFCPDKHKFANLKIIQPAIQ
jgi:hypothetical protein